LIASPARRSGSRRTRIWPIEAPSKFLQAATGAPLHNIFGLRFLEKKKQNQQQILQSTTAELVGAANVEARARSRVWSSHGGQAEKAGRARAQMQRRWAEHNAVQG
jgi:hypothetical protein